MSAGSASFAARVRAGDRVVGTFVKLAAPESIDLVAAAGLDFCVVDAEHSQLTRGDISRLVRHATTSGVPALVRIPVVDVGEVNRLLEAGASGVQLSGLRSAAARQALRSAMRYPPEGARSVSLAQPAASYGARTLIDYLAASAENPPLVVGQIESATTDDPLEDVIGGLDVAFLGTIDLSVDLGVPGELDHSLFLARVGEVAAATAARGVRLGGWTSTATRADRLYAQGATYLVVSSDLQLLQRGMAGLGSLVGAPS